MAKWTGFLPVIRLGWLLAATAIGGGCADREYKNREDPWCSPWEEEEEENRKIESVCRTICEESAGRGAKEVNVLVLSGGGANGAWGAGILNGWRESASRPRPDFDLVTGVSTGALLATYAFLNDPEYDGRLRKVYTKVENRDIFRKRFLPVALFQDALEASEPLKKLIEREITEEVLRRVAAKGATGRRLLVGTVNVDKGCFVPWDLTEIAKEGKLALYRKVLLASASVPVFWPPVMIRGQMHFDGGLREQLFARWTARSLAACARSRLNLYVIVNDKLGVRSTGVDPNLKDIALRTIEILVDEVQVGNLRRVASIVEANRDAHFFLSSIPWNHRLSSNSHEFEPKKMGRLYEEGFAFGKEAEWREKAPEQEELRAAEADHFQERLSATGEEEPEGR
jgi:predicted acylesterase/phospholipase RssA